MTTMNKIEKAVEPLRIDAMNEADKFARRQVEEVRKQLAAAENDLNKAAPHPRAWNLSRFEYMRMMQKRQLFGQVCKFREASYRINQPQFADVNEDQVATFVRHAREDASLQYEKYIAKLNNKIGPVTEAKLDGNYVWSLSYLKVTKADGTKETWKTKMIFNTSKLGKVFAQFPTRVVK